MKQGDSGMNGTSTVEETPAAQGFINTVFLAPPENPRQIVFVPVRDAPARAKEFNDAMSGFTDIARTAGLLLEDFPKERAEFLQSVQNAAQATLCGPRYSISDANSGIANCKVRAEDAALWVRSRRLFSYNIYLVLFGFLPLVAGLLFYRTGAFGWIDGINGKYAGLLGNAATACFIVAGATICVWAEFVLRTHDAPSYDKILTLDAGRWRPYQIVLITNIISFIFAYLLIFKVVQIGLGGLLLNDFASEKNPIPELGLAVGGITGLAFSAVRDVIYRVKPENKP